MPTIIIGMPEYGDKYRKFLNIGTGIIDVMTLLNKYYPFCNLKIVTKSSVVFYY